MSDYVHGLHLTSRLDGGAEEHHFYDGLGSTRGLTDSAGAVVVTYEYDIFGAIRTQAGSSGNDFTYTGEQNDPTGLEYVRAKYYDSARLTPLRVIGGALVLGALGLVSAFLLVWALFSWRTPHFDRSDVVGVYVAKYPSGTETLALKEDGTFVQEVVLKEPQDTTPVTHTGTWTFDEQAQIVKIPGCMAVRGRGDINPTFGTDLSACALPVERQGIFFGPITLSGDANIVLRKVD